MINFTKHIKWRPVRDIPNEKGYKLTLLMTDRRLVECEVDRDYSDGMHYLPGVKLADVTGWCPR